MKQAAISFHIAMHYLLDVGDEDVATLALAACMRELHKIVRERGPDTPMAEAALNDLKVLYMSFAGEAIFAGASRGDTSVKFAEFLQINAVWAAAFRNL